MIYKKVPIGSTRYSRVHIVHKYICVTVCNRWTMINVIYKNIYVKVNQIKNQNSPITRENK